MLDYHSDKNWYKSSINPIVNWSNNLKFYKNILNISNFHPEILFVLKVKTIIGQKFRFLKIFLKKLKIKKILFFLIKIIKLLISK